MYKTTVILHTLEQAKRFVQICGEQSFNIELAAGEKVVHAKSIIGVLSMEMGLPMELSVLDADENAVALFAEKLKPFLMD